MIKKKSRASILEDIFKKRLTELGFRRKEPRAFLCPVSDTTTGFVGLTLTHWKKTTSIFPVVGVRDSRVEKLVAALRGSKNIPIAPTVRRDLHLLDPREPVRRWTVTDNIDMKLIEDCLTAIQRYGIPFIFGHSTLQTMRTALTERPLNLNGWRYRIAAIDYVLGESETGLSVLREGLGAIGDRDTPADREFRRFLSGYESLLTKR